MKIKDAIKNGKKVFCIPSSLENKKGITPNKLIKEGAFLVTEVEDIINQYPEINFKCISRRGRKPNYEWFQIL